LYSRAFIFFFKGIKNREILKIQAAEAAFATMYLCGAGQGVGFEDCEEAASAPASPRGALQITESVTCGETASAPASQ